MLSTEPARLTPSAPARHFEPELAARLGCLEEYLLHRRPLLPLSRHPACALVLQRAFGHAPLCLEARVDGELKGCLLLSHVRSLLFGRYLVSLPYFNYGGVVSDDAEAAKVLIDRAVHLADQLNARHLELRHEEPVPHPTLGHTRTDKVHMRLHLPATADELWRQLPSKVRNQVRKGEKSGLSIHWGTADLLADFYRVFCRNMRDLGTPVYGKRLFSSLLDQFPRRAELCVVRAGGRPVAGALLLHGWGVTEVPSASSLRQYNPTCANMLMYWQLLRRAVERGQRVFDFGRSSQDSPTFKFKKQWGAEPQPAHWQFYLRAGSGTETRPDNPRYRTFIRIWQKLPVAVTRVLGPAIVRGIP